MPTRRVRLMVLSAWFVQLLVTANAHAQAPSQPSAAAPASDPLALAKELNREGIALLQAGDVERALDYFTRSRAALASSKNTANIAICLDRLGRYDEALEFYEELLVKFASGLDDEDRAAIPVAMAALMKKVGSVTVLSTPGASIVVDNRVRGTFPVGPIRVLGGPHVVRALKDGYETFEKKIDVTIGTETSIDARLKPLSGVGQLRVEDKSAGAAVFVDDKEVGPAPWEGVVGIGNHLIWTRGEKVGTAPVRVLIVEHQTALVRVESLPLGPEIVVRAEPRSAAIEIDGTPLGQGPWQGALPAGEHAFTASEAGYHDAGIKLSPHAEQRGEPVEIVLRLAIDASHPRWPKPIVPAKGHPWIEAFLGYAGGATLGSTAESECPERCNENPTVDGLSIGARAGYRFPFGLSLELGGGFLALATAFDRTKQSRFGDHDQYVVTYHLHDELTLSGPFAGAGASYRIPLAGRFAANARLTAGVVFSSSHDPVDGTAATTGAATPVSLGDRNATLHGAAFFLGSSAGVTASIGPVDLGLALGFLVFPSDGPSFAHASFQPAPNRNPADPGAVGNAPASSAIAGERAYGAFAVWAPEISVGHVF